MNTGDNVLVMGVRTRTRITCDSEDCGLDHFEHLEGWGRYHYEDGPREGLPGVVLGLEDAVWPSTVEKVVVRTVDGSIVSCDAEDVVANG